MADALYSIFLSAKYFAPNSTFSLRRILTVLTDDGSQTLTRQKKELPLDSLDRLRDARIPFGMDAELMKVLRLDGKDFPVESQRTQRCRRLQSSMEPILEHFQQLGCIRGTNPSPASV